MAPKATKRAKLSDDPKIAPNESPKRARIFLCRHGQTDKNKARIVQGSGLDVSLNEHGRREAQALADKLAPMAREIDAVHASPLKRATETAAALSRIEGMPSDVVYNVRLREMSYGAWEGKEIASGPIKADFEKLTKDWAAGNTRTRAPNGEFPHEVAARATEALFDDVLLNADRNAHKNVILVCHSRFNRILLSSLFSEPLLGVPTLPRSDVSNMHLFTQGNCCISTFDYDKESGEFLLQELNHTSHLPHGSLLASATTELLQGKLG